MGHYPEIYHAACNALVNRLWADGTRRIVARCLRHYRRKGDRAMVDHCRSHFAFVGWPIRLRANGTYR